MLVIAMVFIGYQAPQESSVVANASNLSNRADKTSVDNVVSANIAAAVAKAANLSIAPNVAELAVSAQTKVAFDQANSVNTAKPQIIGTGTSNRSVTAYVTKDGDTVDSLAAYFGITEQTIKWANNLTGNSISAGRELQILPVNGVLYNVKAGDTVDSLVAKYKVDKDRLILYNDLDVSGLTPGARVVLPDAILPNNERPGYVAPVIVTYYAGQGTGFGGNTWNISRGTGSCPTYGYGQCTCYAYARRVQLGLPVGGQWGNASSWAYNARSAGLLVNSSPSVGSIIQNGGGAGHVGIVEAIKDNGDLSISEMNAYVPGGGWNVVSGRIVPAGNIGSYLYIH